MKTKNTAATASKSSAQFSLNVKARKKAKPVVTTARTPQVMIPANYYLELDNHDNTIWAVFPAGVNKNKEKPLGLVMAADKYWAKYAAYDAGIANPQAFYLDIVPASETEHLGTNGVSYVEVKPKYRKQ